MNQDVKGIREIHQADCRETRKLPCQQQHVELDSRQEMKMTTDTPGKVFPEFYIFANIFQVLK